LARNSRGSLPEDVRTEFAGLGELNDVRQRTGELHGRCFSYPDMDLAVWYDDHDAILGFELCYDKGQNERAMKAGGGFPAQRIDDGSAGSAITRK